MTGPRGLASRFCRYLTTCLAAALAAAASAQTPATAPVDPDRNWPVFRGSAAGVAGGDVPQDWDGASGKNILWRTPIPLPGQNSPIVWGDSLFLCAADEHKQVIYCFDATTGTLHWEREVGKPDPDHAPKVMEDTGLAASTMATDGQRVFALFPTGDLAACDFAGTLVWEKRLGPLESQYGYASSLTIWRDRVIVQLDVELKEGKSALLAFDSVTGMEVWRTPRPVPNSWSSPITVETPAGPQVITVADPWTIAYDPQTGRERWRAKCVMGDIAPSPAYAGGVAYIAMENAEAHAVKVDGSGDVTNTHVLWRIDEATPDIVSPLANEQVVILATSHGTVTCLDAKTGKKLWEHEFDGPFCASPILIGDVVYLMQRDGLMYRFRARPEFTLLGSSALGETACATPAAAGGRLYIRGEKHLYCVGAK